MINFILDVLGISLSGSTNVNYDSYIYAGAVMCIFVLFVLAAWAFVTLIRWIVGR